MHFAYETVRNLFENKTTQEMLFNSIDFAIFLPIVFILHWVIPKNNLKLQNLFILATSYFFYGWWDWRFLSLIIFSTFVDYTVGLLLHNVENHYKRRLLLLISICINLGLLGYFKYYNFFLENFLTAFSFLGVNITAGSLQIILPIGISFYTFQSMGYSIDVYRKTIQPTRGFIAFAAYISFFPQLVAGPIERASSLLPQFKVKRSFDYVKAVDGLRQILWGFFKKMVVADNCAEVATHIFNNSDDMGGSTLVLGAVFFAFQIYCDFSGYSDIAIGTARLFGFNLTQNFNFPYFSKSISEFWKRWHISLTSWFRDYVYIPLGGNRKGLGIRVRNVLIVFLVSGLWHGANWTYIIWGALNAFYFLPSLLKQYRKNTMRQIHLPPSFSKTVKFFQMASTFTLILFAWIIFRANNVAHAFSYIQEIFSTSLFEVPPFNEIPKMIKLVVLLFLFVFMEWHGRTGKHVLEIIGLTWKRPIRWALYYLVMLGIFFFSGQQQEFIYFQF
ncbi:MAG: alginate O-acetyltransferase complex protein AlgI [Bacteroidia bacterium]